MESCGCCRHKFGIKLISLYFTYDYSIKITVNILDFIKEHNLVLKSRSEDHRFDPGIQQLKVIHVIETVRKPAA